MDERLYRIFELVYLLNTKGQDLQLTLREDAIGLIDRDCTSIIPYWTDNIYLDEYWKKDYDQMVQGTLDILEEKWRAIND